MLRQAIALILITGAAIAPAITAVHFSSSLSILVASAQTTKKCPNCKKTNAIKNRFCDQCGKQFPQSSGNATKVTTDEKAYETAIGRAEALYDQKRWEGAYERFIDAASYKVSAVRRAYAYNQAGVCAYNSGHYDDAEAAYRKAIAQVSTYGASLANLGELLWRIRKDISGAEYMLYKAVYSSPSIAWAWKKVGNFEKEEKNNYTQAEKMYLKAIETDKTDSDPYIELGIMYYKNMSRSEDGRRMLQSAIDVGPLRPGPHNALGNYFFEEKKDYVEAERCYRRATELNPKGGVYFANQAAALFYLNKKDEAIAAAKKGLAAGYTDHWIYKELGLGG